MEILPNKYTKRIARKITGFILARYFFAKIAIAFIASTAVLLLFLSHALDKFELVTLDQRFKLRPDRPTADAIVLIEMGDDSVDAIGRWPWPREYHAALLTVLERYPASQVIFDVIFDNKSSPSHDLVFAEAIKRSGNVYLPYVFQFKEGDLISAREAADNVRNIIMPLDEFSRHSKGGGHVNVAPDIDGTLRRVPLVIEHNKSLYPQLAFKVVCDYLGVEEENIVLKPGRYILLKDCRAGLNLPYNPSGSRDIKIPIDAHNQMIVNWAGRWTDTFKHYSYNDILDSYRQTLRGEEPKIDLDELKDRICIIGLTASGLYDIRPTPLEPAYPVVGMNANIINSVLNEDFIEKAPGITDIAFIYIMGIFIAVVISRVRFLRGAVYTSMAVLGYVLISFAAFTFFSRWIMVVYPALAMFISFLGVSLYHETILALERKKYFDLSIKDGLTKLFNIRHFKGILDKEFTICVGRKTRKLSLIMMDVDHFKNFNDTYGHQVGDFVLKRVAMMFKDGSRSHDVVARYGGEEFIMMLPGTEIDDAKNIAERIREAIEKTPMKRSNETYSVTISLGVATLRDERTKEEFIKKVDDALYMAKQTGRNRVCVK
ncbi:MAG: CHASE2 domain-containing protein [Candidatus Omnitrophota bacterium]